MFFTDFEDDDFNCTGKFCYRHGNFHNTEAATGGALKTQIKSFTKFTGKRPSQRLFFNKVVGLRSTTLLKNRLRHRCFPVKFLRIPFWKVTVSKNMKAFKLQVTSSVKLKIG